MERRPASRVEAVLAAHAAPEGRGAPAALDRIRARVDRILLDAAETDRLFAAAASGPGREPRLLEPSRWACVAGRELPPGRRLELCECLSRLGAAVALEPSTAGLPGVVATDEGLVGADDVVAGASPDVGALGGLGCVPLRCGPAELAGLLGDPLLATAVPRTLFVRVSGRLPRWSAGFDLALAVRDAAGAALAAGPPSVLELHGATIEALDVPGRLALCGALALAGVGALVPPDARTRTWLAARLRTPSPAPVPPHAPPDDAEWIDVDASAARPVALEGGMSGRRLDPAGPDGPAVVECLVGGRIEDLRQAAEVLRDRNAGPGLALGVQPASQLTLLHAIDEGLAADVLRAGATLASPGADPGPPLAGRRRALTVPGGTSDLLANPAVVAATAIAGRLMEPEAMRRAVRRDSRRR